MRLQQSFLLWIAISAILPLTVLILGLTLYGERLYLQQVSEEVNTALNNIGTDLERSLAYERSIMMQVANSAAMRQYLPVLDAARRGDIHATFYQRTDHLNRFLLSFSRIVHGQGTLRVLDLKGNTMIKVGLGRITPPSFDSFESFPYAEEERSSEDSVVLANELQELKDKEVSFVALIDEPERVLLDGVVPLSHLGQRVGYLVTSLQGQQLDFIMQLAHRPYQGKLSLVEINLDSEKRNGRVLYSDDNSLLFARTDSSHPEAVLKTEALLSALQDRPDGAIKDQTHTFYYTEIFPYPDQLSSWAIVMRVDDEMITSPFQKLRYGILLFAIVTLLASLLAAHLGARQISRPLSLLINNFRALAKGAPTQKITRGGVEELSELGQAFDDLQSSLATAQQERDRAQDMMMQNAKLASIGQLAAGIGHELNNPLNNILSYTRLIERELTDDHRAISKDIQAIREEGERASRIVKGVLSFSHQLPANFTRFAVREWMHQTIGLVNAMAQAKQVRIEATLETDFEIDADRGLLQQALINLLINAIQASPDNSVVELNCQRADEHLLLQVIDRGEGIADEDMDRLFEPFYTTKEVGEGSGLGLSITLGIVEQHQGALQIENCTDDNAEVTGVMASIVLPMRRDIEADTATDNKNQA